MKRILALVKYGPEAASTRQRLLQYMPTLEAADYEIELQILLDNDYVRALAVGKSVSRFKIVGRYWQRLMRLLKGGDHEIVWVHYEVFPFLPGLLDLLATRNGPAIVVDFDDATFHTYDQHRSMLVRHALGRRLEPLLRRSDLVLCGNEYLLSYASRHAGQCRVLPTVVDTQAYSPPHKRCGDGPMVIGWLGSPSTWTFVKPMQGHILDFAARNGAIFQVMGAARKEQGAVGLEMLPWSEEREIPALRLMDVGIMPLPNEPWARGKCGYKLIQYGAVGIPALGSPVGVNKEIIVDGETGFQCRDWNDWQRALQTLQDDPDRRKAMGEAGRERVVQNYSLALYAPKLLRWLETLSTRRRTG